MPHTNKGDFRTTLCPKSKLALPNLAAPVSPHEKARNWFSNSGLFYLIVFHIYPQEISQKNTRLFISRSLFIQHLGSTDYEGFRQSAAVLRADLDAAHTVDARIVEGLAGVIQRNRTNGSLLGTDAAFHAGFVCCGMECRGFQFLIRFVARDLYSCDIV